MGYVNLSKMPSPAKEYVQTFDTLAGGLNLRDLDYRIGNNESPEMKNLMWREGILCSRDGQVWVNDEESEISGFVTAYSKIWNGKMIIHAGTSLYAVDPETAGRTTLYTAVGMTSHGTFFPYNEKLYYKTKGHYVQITYVAGNFTASAVTGYIPITYINCSPANGSGTVYQPENRLSSDKTLWYNASFTLTAQPSSNSLSVVVEDSYFRMRINTPGSYVFSFDGSVWKLDGDTVDLLDYGITLGGTPSNGDTITVVLTFANEYYLPVRDITLASVVVDGQTKAEESVDFTVTSATATAVIDKGVWRTKVTVSGTYTFIYDYNAIPNATWKLEGAAVDITEYGITVSGAPAMDDTIKVVYVRGDFWTDMDAGKIVFFVPPPVTYPETNNTVRITYTKANTDAYKSIDDCTIVAVYGGTGALCVVMAGSENQPNAYFWNGQTNIAMDPSYFPMTQYQFAGDAEDPITAFGKQQGYLIIFKQESLGRTSLGTETVDDRLTIDLPYTGINAKIGCDLPYTVELVENNLVWCNTTQGVHFLANTSAAYENNVVCLSQKVNNSGATWNQGLLWDVRNNTVDTIVSCDDEKRYWLIVNGHVWLWDYDISQYTKPSWFYFDNVYGRAFISKDEEVWHFNSNSRLSKFKRVYFDYDPVNGAIDKVFQFATQFFGTYDRKKNVNSVIVNTRSDTNTIIELKYLTDYEERYDLTPLSGISWSLVPRNLTFRDLSCYGFAYVFRRKPHCRRVQFFTMRLENNLPEMDMSIVSAQIYYEFQGRQR